MSEAPVQLFARRTAKRRKSELVADCKTAVEGNVASPVRTAGSSETAALPLPERGANQASSSGRSHDGANATKIKSDESAPPPTSFRELGVSEWLCGVLRGLGITQPTAVQAGCIPAALAGRDVIGTAQTGSGKTAAFALPILQQLAADPYGVFALVLTPTRELAIQLAEQFRAFGAGMSLRDAVIIGGLYDQAQARELARRPHVVVATPGRLAALLEANAELSKGLSRLRHLVLDEADRLLEVSFEAPLRTLLPLLPPPGQRQTHLFSATLTPALVKLQAASLRDAHVFQAYEGLTTAEHLDERYVFIPAKVKDVYLAHLLYTRLAGLAQQQAVVAQESRGSNGRPRKGGGSGRSGGGGGGGGGTGATIAAATGGASPPTTAALSLARSAIVFASTCRGARMLGLLLRELGVPAAVLHSGKPQRARLAALASFRAGAVPLLLATDVAARGLDIPTVDLVINYDLPTQPADYVHRVGRTARAGRGGCAVSLVSQYEVELVAAIEGRIGHQLLELELEEAAVLKGLGRVYSAKKAAALAALAEDDAAAVGGSGGGQRGGGGGRARGDVRRGGKTVVG